jgi:hypothetical protein
MPASVPAFPPGAAVDGGPILIPACGEAQRQSPKIQLFFALIPKALTQFAISQPLAPVLASNREAAPRKPGRDLHPGQDALLYVDSELPEPLSLTDVTDR